MAPPNPDQKSDKSDLDQSIGAEFEENTPVAPKIVINDKARVKKPEYSGDKSSVDTEQDTPRLTDTKSSTLKPDITEKEAKPDELQIDDGQAVDVLAKAAADEKNSKDGGDNSVKQKNIQNLIDNKTYFVPTGQVTKRRNAKIFLGVILAVIILGIAGYVLMSGASQ